MKEYVPIAEAAERLGVSVDTVRRELRAGTFPGGWQLQTRWVIRRAPFERFMAGTDEFAAVNPAKLRRKIVNLAEQRTKKAS